MELFLGHELFWFTAFVGLLGMALLYDKSPTFKYRLKFVVYIAYFSLVALGMIPFIIFRPKDVRNILLGIPFLKPVSRLLGIRWEVSGKEILAKDFPCVVVCNHQSMLDVLGIVQLWPTMKKCACISKKEVLYVFPFGLMAWLCGTVYINRRNPNDSLTKLSTSAELICKNKTKLWIFPEGTRSKKGELLQFKKGAFHIAMQNKLPIVPVVFSPYSFIDDNKKIFGSGTMKIKVLDPIETANLEYPEDISKLVENCHNLMNLEYKKLNEQLLTSSGKTLTGKSNVNGVANEVFGKHDQDNIAFCQKARTS